MYMFTTPSADTFNIVAQLIQPKKEILQSRL